MIQAANVEVARKLFRAYASKDRALAETIIAGDFHFTSPIDNRLDRATYFSRCWPNSETSEGYEIVNIVPTGDRIVVTYEGKSTNGHRFRNTEILTVRGDQIVEEEVYFGWTLPHKAAPGGFVEQQ